MRIPSPILAALILCLADSASLAHAGDTGEAIDGRVHHVSDGAIDVCFNDTAAANVGSRLTVIRHDIVAPTAKAVPMIKSANVGEAEIVSTDRDHCATARLVGGKARALDWVAIER